MPEPRTNIDYDRLGDQLESIAPRPRPSVPSNDDINAALGRPTGGDESETPTDPEFLEFADRWLAANPQASPDDLVPTQADRVISDLLPELDLTEYAREKLSKLPPEIQEIIDRATHGDRSRPDLQVTEDLGLPPNLESEADYRSNQPVRTGQQAADMPGPGASVTDWYGIDRPLGNDAVVRAVEIAIRMLRTPEQSERWTPLSDELVQTIHEQGWPPETYADIVRAAKQMLTGTSTEEPNRRIELLARDLSSDDLESDAPITPLESGARIRRAHHIPTKTAADDDPRGASSHPRFRRLGQTDGSRIVDVDDEALLMDTEGRLELFRRTDGPREGTISIGGNHYEFDREVSPDELETPDAAEPTDSDHPRTTDRGAEDRALEIRQLQQLGLADPHDVARFKSGDM